MKFIALIQFCRMVHADVNAVEMRRDGTEMVIGFHLHMES